MLLFLPPSKLTSWSATLASLAGVAGGPSAEDVVTKAVNDFT